MIWGTRRRPFFITQFLLTCLQGTWSSNLGALVFEWALTDAIQNPSSPQTAMFVRCLECTEHFHVHSHIWFSQQLILQIMKLDYLLKEAWTSWVMQWGRASSPSGFRRCQLPSMLTGLKRPALLREVPLKADRGIRRGFTLAHYVPCTPSSKMGSSFNIHTSRMYWAPTLIQTPGSWHWRRQSPCPENLSSSSEDTH